MKRLIGFCLITVALVLALGCNKTTVTLTAEEQLAYDVAAIDEYLTRTNVNAIKLESGVRYVLTEVGTGPLPTKDNCVGLRYVLTKLNDTTRYDYNYSAAGYHRPLKNLITGVQIALKLMPLGSKGSIYIPSGLGYGPNPDAQVTVGRNAILRFDVDLFAMSNYNALGNYCY
ncbi:MAG TPA: FKBP-type peptidyl-prolyl cis-trans isomerase [Cyclobacteriaceae bacterium]|nr:FKBP-type peptidyl-prolyl cis-trans isomerase [Cyclobacteriaceae bacterium]